MAACLLQLALGSVYGWSPFGAALGPGSASMMHLTAAQAVDPFEAALGMIVFGAALGGWLQDRIGPRVVALTGGAVYSAGMLIASSAYTHDQFGRLLIGYGYIGGLGLGIAYVTPTPMLLRWFPDHRALAAAIAQAAFGFGGLLTTCVAAPIIAHHSADPAAAFLPLGVIYLLMLLVGGTQFRNPPECVIVSGATRGAGQGMTLREALATPHWYLLTLILFANVAVSVAFIATAVGGGRALVGFSTDQAAIVVSVIAIFNGAGRIVWAAISERIGRITVFIAILAIQACCLYGVALVHSPAAFYAASILIGLCCGGGFGTMPATVGEYFGIRHAGGIWGCMLVAWSAGGIIGPRWVSEIISHPTPATYSDAYVQLGVGATAAIAIALITVRLPTLGDTVGPEWVLGRRRELLTSDAVAHHNEIRMTTGQQLPAARG